MKFSLHVVPFPDIHARFGRGYPNVTESIRSHKIPSLSRKTDSEWNKELQSNLVKHRFALSEKEAIHAVRHGWDVGDKELLDASGSSSGGVSESKEPEPKVEPKVEPKSEPTVEATPAFDMFARDDDDDEYEAGEEEEDVRVGGVTETAEETDNPKAVILGKFMDAGYSLVSIPESMNELKLFMKGMRDQNIVQINYSSKATPIQNRIRLIEKLGL